MNKKNIMTKVYPERKTVSVTIRIAPTLSKWLSEQKYSPTGIFMESVKDLGFKQEVKPTKA